MIDHTFAICAYGESEFLEECIVSIKKQADNSSVIIVTSTENGHITKLAQKYSLEYFSHQGKGIGNDWNFAYSCARTKYVTLVHQDDVYTETYFKNMMKEMNKEPDALIGFSSYLELRNGEIVQENSNLKIKNILLKPLKISKRKKFVKRLVVSFGNPICCPAVTYNKENLLEFTFNTKLKTNLDWEAWIKLAAEDGAFVYVKKPLMHHRIHADSETSNTIENKERAAEDLMMFEKIWPNPIAKLIGRFYLKSEKKNEV